jgi:hypothetical protein
MTDHGIQPLSEANAGFKVNGEFVIVYDTYLIMLSSIKEEISYFTLP